MTPKLNRHAMVAMVNARQRMMDAVLSVDIAAVDALLEQGHSPDHERIDGNRGVLHAALLMCA